MATNFRFDFPSNSPLTTDGQQANASWLQWFTRIQTLSTTLNNSGTTAQRPTEGLWVGRFYMDTTLNKPIWVKQVKPTVVWIDAAGTVV